MEALIAEVENSKQAVEVANAAESVVVEMDDGEVVRSLNVRLSPTETKRVMSLPPAARAAMAERILKERSIRHQVARDMDRDVRQARRRRKVERKRRNKSKRRNR